MIIKVSKIVPERLALLNEAAARELHDAVYIVGHVCSALQANHRGINFGRRPKRRWRNLQDQLHLAIQLGAHGKKTVVAASWRSAEPVGNFPLHEKNRPRKSVIEREEAFYDGRGDVVRQISHDRCRTPLSQVYLENVASMQMKACVVAELQLQIRCQRVVEFNSVQFLGTREKMTGKSAAPRSNLDNPWCPTLAGRVCDSLEYRLPDKEMLAEFTGQSSV